jgi:hypothetical protein
MTLTERFLKARHWQLFLLTFGLAMIFQFIIMGTMFASIGNGEQPDPGAFLRFFYAFPVMMAILTGTLFGWFWSIAIGLQKKLPANVTMKTSKFKIFFFIPLLYMVLISITVGAAMIGILEKGAEPNPALIAGLMAIILPLHLFSMFCMFYCLYFVSKTIKTIELQRETTFSDFAGEFFLIWFYPVGIWIIQPRINQMVDATPDMLT